MPPPDSCTGPDDASCGSSTADPTPTSCSTPTSASPSSPETTLAVHPIGHHTHDTRSPTASQCSQAHQWPTPSRVDHEIGAPPLGELPTRHCRPSPEI